MGHACQLSGELGVCMQLYGACVCMYVCVSSPSATPAASTPHTLYCEYVRVRVPCEYLYVCVCVCVCAL